LHELYLVTRSSLEHYKLAEGETYLIMDSGGIVIGPRSNRGLYLCRVRRGLGYEPVAEKKRCRFCHQQISADAKYRPYCGRRLK